MNELQFDTGLRTYTVNGGNQISFHPGDAGFVKKIFTMMENIKSVCEAEPTQEATENAYAMFAYADTRDQKIRAEIDAVFGEGTADAIIECDCMALAGGLPVWLNFTMSILDEMDANLLEQQKQANPRMEKYMAKYAKYRGK